MKPQNLPPWFSGTHRRRCCVAAKERLIRTKEGDRAIILITDGGSADFQQRRRPADLAQELADQNIRVFTILIGNDTFGTGIYTVGNSDGRKSVSEWRCRRIRIGLPRDRPDAKATFKQTTSVVVSTRHTPSPDSAPPGFAGPDAPRIENLLRGDHAC
ncbi:MAG: VWA domain-containing protein [Verrucomicrobia bacterium]|nr:VWA domain-containing protein [Verrucomicrobiota bacterium]